MNAHDRTARSPRPLSGASDATHIVLTFENNRLASELFGQFDQNLALLEQKLGVDARARGNTVTITGEEIATDQARRALDYLYDRLQGGGNVEPSDVEGAIRMARGRRRPAVAADAREQGPPVARPDIDAEEDHRRALADAGRLYPRHGPGRAGLRRRSRPARARPTWPSPMQPSCSNAARWSASSCRARRSKRASGSGFLPGDMKEKVDPYLRPLYDALYDMIPGDKVERAITAGVIEIAPLAFMRGRTLSNAAVILDEAQNTTSIQMKMFLTRLGENARMIVTGDPSQIDLPRGVKSGLVEALHVLNGVEGVVTCRFRDVDVVRHPLVARIVAAYDAESSMVEDSGRSD